MIFIGLILVVDNGRIIFLVVVAFRLVFLSLFVVIVVVIVIIIVEPLCRRVLLLFILPIRLIIIKGK